MKVQLADRAEIPNGLLVSPTSSRRRIGLETERVREMLEIEENIDV